MGSSLACGMESEGWVNVVSGAESGKRGTVRRGRENGGGMQCRRSGLKSIGKLFG